MQVQAVDRQIGGSVRCLSLVALGHLLPFGHQGAQSWTHWLGHCQAWQFPSVRNLGWNCLPWCPAVGDPGVPVVGPAPFSRLCLCRVAEIIWIASWIWFKLPAEFLFHGVTEGWGGGYGSFIRGWAFSPPALPAMFLQSQQHGGGSASSWGSADRVLAHRLPCDPFPRYGTPPRPAYPLLTLP